MRFHGTPAVVTVYETSDGCEVLCSAKFATDGAVGDHLAELSAVPEIRAVRVLVVGCIRGGMPIGPP